MAKKAFRKASENTAAARPLTYEVEKGDAIEVKELPFVVGVVGDLAGHSEIEQPKLRDRKSSTSIATISTT